jgi:hypothetical protein
VIVVQPTSTQFQPTLPPIQPTATNPPAATSTLRPPRPPTRTPTPLPLPTITLLPPIATTEPPPATATTEPSLPPSSTPEPPVQEPTGTTEPPPAGETPTPSGIIDSLLGLVFLLSLRFLR